MKKLFDLSLGYDEKTGQYFALVNSVTDNKRMTIANENIRVVMSKVSKRIRQKAQDIKLFPLPHDQPKRGYLTHAEIKECRDELMDVMVKKN